MRIETKGKGLPPKIDSFTKHSWQFDAATNAPNLVFGSEDLTQALAISPQSSPIGQAVQFNGTQHFSGSIIGADAPLFTSNYTLNALFKIDSLLAVRTIVNYGVGLGTLAADNILLNVSILTTGQMRFFWEYNNSVNQSFDSAFKFVPNSWYYISVVKRGTSLELWVNGRKTETFLNTITPSGGSNGFWRIGADSIGTDPFSGQISFLDFHTNAFTELQIQNNIKRAHLTGFHTHFTPKVEVRDSLNNWVDLTNLEGHNWLESLQISKSVDGLCDVLDLTCTREIENYSLAWLKTDSKLNLSDIANLNSYSPLIRAGNSIRCSFAKMPLFLDAQVADFQNQFEGEIDSVNASSSPMRLNCRDLGAQLSYIQIETDNQIYPSANTTQPVLTVMQEVIAAWVSSNPIVYMPVDSQAVVVPYKQKRGNVHEPLRSLAAISGWDCKYRWDQGTETHRLTYFDPQRDRLDADIVLGDAEYLNITNLKQDRTKVRNKINLNYLNTLDIDATTQEPKPNTITVFDAISQSQYGLQFAEITEVATKHIDTPTEALAMATAILSDLKDPEAEQSLELPMQFELDLYDTCVFQANKVHYSKDQVFSVISVQHSWQAGQGATTTITTRGKPTTGTLRWFYMFGGILNVPRIPISPPLDIGILGFSTTAIEGGFLVNHNLPPADSFWEHTRVFADPLINFIPGTTNLVGQGKSTEFNISGLTPGVIHYLKAETSDRRGNTVLHDLGSITPLFQQISAVNPDFSYGGNTFVLNAALSMFGTANGTNSPPEGWAVPSGEWGTDLGSSSGGATGSNSVIMITNSATLQSKRFIVKGDQFYKIDTSFIFDVDINTAIGNVYVNWYNTAGTFISVSQVIQAIGDTGGAVQQEVGFAVSPNLAAYAEIKIDRAGSTYAFLWALYVDYVDFQEIPVSFSMYNSTLTTAVAAGVESVLKFNAFNHAHGKSSLFNAPLGQFIAPKSGLYSFAARGNFSTVSANKARAALQINGTVKHTGTWRASVGTGMSAGISVSSVLLARNDLVEVSVFSTGSYNFAPSQTSFWFTGHQVA